MDTTQYMNRLAELALSIFHWVNVPVDIDLKYPELTHNSNQSSETRRTKWLDEEEVISQNPCE